MRIEERNFVEGEQFLVFIPENKEEEKLLDRLGNALNEPSVKVVMCCSDNFTPYLRATCAIRSDKR